MTPRARSTLAQVPLMIQGLAAICAVSVLTFVNTAMQTFVAKHQELILPAPTRLSLWHPDLTRALVLAMFALSCLGYRWTKKKVNEEADQLAIQGVVQSLVWYFGITYVGAVIMADMLPYFAINR